MIHLYLRVCYKALPKWGIFGGGVLEFYAEHADQPVTPVKQRTITYWRETAARTNGADG